MGDYNPGNHRACKLHNSCEHELSAQVASLLCAEMQQRQRELVDKRHLLEVPHLAKCGIIVLRILKRFHATH